VAAARRGSAGGLAKELTMRSKVWVSVLAATVLLIAAPRASSAEEPAEAPASMFPEGMWTLQLYGAYVPSYETDDKLASGTLGGSYYFGERHSVLFELAGYSFDPEGSFDAEDSCGGGANLGLRFQFFELDRLTLFVEGLAVMQEITHNFTQGGTHFNFNTQAGLGATFRIAENIHLIGGCRYVHISNAQIHGKSRNPNFNGVGGYLGVMFTF
jgi:hypothetical protein